MLKINTLLSFVFLLVASAAFAYVYAACRTLQEELVVANEKLETQQEIGDLLILLFWADESRPDLQQRLKALPFDKEDKLVVDLGVAVVRAKKDPTPANVQGVLRAKRAFDRGLR